MLDVNDISERLDEIRQACRDKRADVDLDRIASLNAERKSLNGRFDELRHSKKTLGPRIQEAKKTGADATALLDESNRLKQDEKDVAARLREVETELDQLLLWVPNPPHPESPRGDVSKNRVVKTWGEPKSFDFAAKEHSELCTLHGVDTDNRGVKVAGSGFAMFQGQGARFVRSLINYFLDVHTGEHGYTEVSVPFLVNRKTMTGTGQLPKLEEDMYHLDREDLFLIPTSEVPVTNLHQDEMLRAEELPITYACYSPCFRREAGAYGRDTKGLMRLHQFDKVELVRICNDETSEREHEILLGHVETILQKLGLHYRVLDLATGDMSFAAWRCYDVEVWAPASQRWFECSSVSNFRDFQARRAQIRYKHGNQKPRYCHTLNGSGLALPRMVLCLLETFQEASGAVVVPEVLRDRMGCERLEPMRRSG